MIPAAHWAGSAHRGCAESRSVGANVGLTTWRHASGEVDWSGETLDDAVRYVREHKSRDLADRKSVIHQLENASTREQMLDAINAFRAWLEAEDLVFPTD